MLLWISWVISLICFGISMWRVFYWAWKMHRETIRLTGATHAALNGNDFVPEQAVKWYLVWLGFMAISGLCFFYTIVRMI